MKVHNYKTIGKGKLECIFTLELPSGMMIHECKLIRGEKGDFVSFPSRTFESNGETRYKNLVVIPDKEANNRFQEAALKSVQPFTESSNNSNHEDTPPVQELIPF